VLLLSLVVGTLVRFGADQTRPTTLALLVECFEELAGVPEVVLSDRMGYLKAGGVANVVVPHPEHVAFATRFPSPTTATSTVGTIQ